MIRARFKVADEDYRPVKFPPPGPYWCSGYDPDDKAFLIAFAKDEQNLLEYWPDAEEIDAEIVERIDFSDRFTCPEWWPA